MNRTWTKDEIKYKIFTSDEWLYRAILAIYSKQSDKEKETGETRYENGVGFTGYDARSLSYYAKWILRHKKLDRWHINIVRERMMKYAKQLTKIANNECGAPKEVPSVRAHRLNVRNKLNYLGIEITDEMDLDSMKSSPDENS